MDRFSCLSPAVITRNHPSLWTRSKVVHRIASAADVPKFSTHTTRHLCLTDLARMGWELHTIATFAGHRLTDSTLDISTCPAGILPTSSVAAWTLSMPSASRYSRRQEHHGDRDI